MNSNGTSYQQEKQHQVDHVFRHHYGQLVASLSKRVGIENLGLVEDAVQDAMLSALGAWSVSGEPKQPSAWLYQVAYRTLMSGFRTDKRKQTLLIQQALIHADEQENKQEIGLQVPLSKEMADDMLSLLFICCDFSLPKQSQLVFTLKSVCGFNTNEIAKRLFITEANVYKRFNRAKSSLQTSELDIANLSLFELNNRFSNVLNVIYLIFTEGYLSSHPDNAIRLDLCQEAIHLASVLSKHPIGNKPESLALLALMYFHLARMNSRQAGSGKLILFSDQDRSLWHQGHIKTAMEYLMKSAQGEQVSRYHLEASIAAEHCLAPSFEQTNWQNILSAYDKLQQVSPSALLALNRAIVVSHLEGPDAALACLATLTPPNWLACSYHWYAVKADLLFQIIGHQTGEDENYLEVTHYETAYLEGQKAIDAAPTEHIKALLKKRFDRYLA